MRRFLHKSGRHFGVLICGVAAVLCATVVRAEVVRVQIDRREPFAEGVAFGRSGPYERLLGRMFLEVDPESELNERIVDLKLAPRNAAGRVEFWTDFFLLKPVDTSRGNRRLLYDVNNRGNKLALGAFNNQGGNDPRTRQDAGNGFLMREGYSILWCGWNGDALPGNDRLQIGIPIATDNGQPITGRVHAEICVNEKSYSQPLYWGNSDPYPAVSLDQTEAVLTIRPSRDHPAQEVPRAAWRFAREEQGQPIDDPRQLYIQEGFRPGWLYELVYTARDPRVTGLGFAAVRDVVSFLRSAPKNAAEEGNPLAGCVERAYVFGISQSGRFIQHFVFEGFNLDERGKMVFDGAIAHVGGGGRGYFNHRFAQTTRHGSQHEDNLSPSDLFPFTSLPQEDPQTGERGSILDRPRRQGSTPRLFFTETSTEYWSRAASLLHTDVEGEVDVGLDPFVRLYVIAGAQHGVSSSSDPGIYQNPVNVLDHRPVLRALLRRLDAWVTTGEEPPPSRHPRIVDGTLIPLEAYRRLAPSIPGVYWPRAMYSPLRLDFGPRFRSEGIADVIPPHVGNPYRTLVPAVDADGNELAGIRLPEVAVPIATFTGWNTRSASAGAEGALGRWAGSYLPFAVTHEARQQSGDPRPAVRERYPTRADYLARLADASLSLIDAGFLLDEDAVRLLKRESERELWE
ncbi:MAG: alpha/beta hydrolase domain-containing protein [Planctomycetales bacterium]